MISGEPQFAFFEHTADVGVRAWGATLEQAFASAALAVFELMADSSNVRDDVERLVEIEGTDLEDLLFAWLNELLYLSTVERLLLCRFDVRRVLPTRLEASVFGEPIDPSRHHLRTEIKAATYHMLRVEQDGDWHIQVILDL